MTQTVWRDEAARERLENWFNRFRNRVRVPIEHRELPTRFGGSHVLIAGPDDAPPLVCLHAMRTGSAFLLSEITLLCERFRIFVPDLPGQSVRGLQRRLPVTDNSHAQWLTDVLNGLELKTANLFGVSWGGFVARQTATLVPERIERLALLVPAGIVRGSHWKGIAGMAIPMLRYRIWRTEANLERLLSPLFTTWDNDWAGFTADTVRDMPFDMRIPPLATDKELSQLEMPVLVLAGADDICFPGQQLVGRMLKTVPDCEGEVIPACKHCPPTTPEFREWLADRLTRFFIQE